MANKQPDKALAFYLDTFADMAAKIWALDLDNPENEVQLETQKYKATINRSKLSEHALSLFQHPEYAAYVT